MKRLKRFETTRQFEKDLKQLGLLAELGDVLHYTTTNSKAISKSTVNAT